MFSIYGTKINLTRGDTFLADLEIKWEKDNVPYTPSSGDVIRFALKRDYYDDEPLILKTIDPNDMVLRLDPSDTKDLPFGNYVYDIEITMEDGYVDTFISDNLVLGYEVV